MKFIKITDKEKEALLEFLGYAVNKDGLVVSKETGKLVECPYTRESVRFETASIMPGSTVIFNTTELALAQYFSEHIENGERKCQKSQT